MFEKYIGVKIIPAAVVNNEDEIRHIAELCLQYLPALELTMRTPYSYAALELLTKEYPQLPVAAATVLSPTQANHVTDMGAKIIITPGFQPVLLEHCQKQGYHYIPGVATPAEIEQCLAYNYKYLKMFPASVLGGVDWLKAMLPVYSHTGVKFMPLGGVNMENATEYLRQPNVFACGGTWLCAKNLLEAKDWQGLRKRFQEAVTLIASQN
ncbi:MAG: bifunctional 4-hydroxy-2-oxoglutarate aldolase/2-dehydro-3-deoxy-phosphogluconate aldolase [Brevinema sp.]